MVSQFYKKITSHFEQKWRRDGNFKVQGFDIATLLGAKGPQQGPQGPKGPQPSVGARRMGGEHPKLLVL